MKAQEYARVIFPYPSQRPDTGSPLKLTQANTDRTALPAGNGVVVPTGTDPIELVEVQPEGKPRMPARAWANGAHWRDGDILGT